MTRAAALLALLASLASLSSACADEPPPIPIARSAAAVRALPPSTVAVLVRGLDDDGFFALGRLTGLRHLIVEQLDAEGEEHLRRLAELPIVHLELQYRVEADGPQTASRRAFEELARIESLRRLDLRCELGPLTGLRRLTRLKALSLQATDGRGVAQLSALRELEALHLGQDARPGDAGWARIAGLPKLTLLEHEGQRVTTAQLKTLAGAPKLTTLVLPLADGVSPEPLRAARALRTLALWRVSSGRLAELRQLADLKLETLVVSAPKWTADGLQALRDLRSVAHLELRWSAFQELAPLFDDGALRALEAMPALRRLTIALPFRAPPPEVIAALRRSLPRAAVRVDRGD